jgi:peptidoglycan/xylan/chitin deacetylase (PgdA/CDA1 family)
MRRMVPLVIALAFALAGCSGPPSAMLAWHAGQTLAARPALFRATALPPRCGGPRQLVTTAPAHQSGPHGSVQTTGSAAVALTFDDGPDPVNTPKMLDVLKACGVKATFCLIGDKVAAYAAVVRRIVAEGHTLCNHTWDHNTQLGTYGQLGIQQSLQRTNDAIHAVVPGVKIAYFRAPGGEWTSDYVTVAHQLGMTPIDWDVDPWDWNFAKNGTGETMTAHIVDYVRSHVRPGSIILSHDNLKPDTVEAYRRLLPWLTAHFTLIALPTSPASSQ